MSFFLLQSNWGLLWREIWEPLAKTTSAPPDMFIELFRYASTRLGVEPKIEAFNDPKLAKEEFKKLPIPPEERKCIALLEGFYETLSQFNTNIETKYYLKLKEFIERRNLRYILTPDCKIQLSIPGLLISQYSCLKKAISRNHTRIQCLNELELNIGRLNDNEVERNCIRVASNLLEGVVVDKTTSRERTFGKALDGCASFFPHKSLIESAKNFYRFFNDYPNLRHPGRQQLKIRELKKDDAVLTISFAVLFASYIAENDASQVILSGNLSP